MSPQRAAALVLAALFAATPFGQSQDKAKAPPTTPVAVENTNANLTPTNVNIPEANPARPTITNPAHIPPTGYLQFEDGFNLAHNSPSGTRNQLALSQVTKIALTTRLQVQFASEPYTYSTMTDPPSNSTDPGDLQIGVQGILLKAAGALPTTALGYIRRVRAGSAPDLDLEGYSQSLVLLIGGDLPKGFHYDSNILFNEQSDDGIRRAQFGQTLSVSHPIFAAATDQRLSGIAELYHFTQPLLKQTVGTPVHRANAVDLLLASTYAIRPNLIVDAAFDHGLTSTSTQWQGTVGLTYLLPHRLWPDRHPVPRPATKPRYRNTR